MPDSTEVLASLNEDLALEHAAIVQYIIHGALLRDVAITDPVRKIAREEMWHFEWLAEAIRDRGGEPGLDRDEVFLPAMMAAGMREDVRAEERALSHYAHTLELLGDSDPELSRLIERIVEDERHHHTQFERLAAEVRDGGEGTYSAHPIMGPEDMAVVGPTIGLEYASLLQYLWNKYGCGDCEQGEQYFEFAVDEMRHMTWVAAYVPGVASPMPPPVPSDMVRFAHSTAEAREYAERLESAAAEFYSAKIGEAKCEELGDDLRRALGQHEFHRRRLEKMG
jgi:bacterioferritin